MSIQKYYLFTLLFWCGGLLPGLSQPLICDGSLYLSINSDGLTTFYRVIVDPPSGTVDFTPFTPNGTPNYLNAVGYRRTDNYIYAVQPNLHRLYRIGQNQQAIFLSDLNLTSGFDYFAGDVTPDGQYLALLGSGGEPYRSRQIALVDLDNYDVDILTINQTGDYNVFCADIAFDPTDGLMYGFDQRANRLVTLDLTTLDVDEISYPTTDQCDALGAIFFDAFGNLFGYGDALGANFAVNFYSIDKTTGTFTVEAQGPMTASKDGCSCPYTVELQKTVSPEVTIPCTEVIYSFRIANSSQVPQMGVKLTDALPPDLTITEIIQNPFGGQVVSGVGDNVLEIVEMTIPTGIDSILLRVEVGPNAMGLRQNQARLTNLPASLGGASSSDNPRTLALDDSTDLWVEPFVLDFPTELNGCPGDTIALDGMAPNALSYLWNTGAMTPELEVTEEGWYSVTVTSGCATRVDSVWVSFDGLEVELGPDITLDLGDSVWLEPQYFNSSETEDFDFLWSDPLGNSLRAPNAFATWARPLVDARYQLTISSDNVDCWATDDIVVRVQADRQIYIPNAFTPDFDGTNDWFFLQGQDVARVRRLSVYDRWGAQVFDSGLAALNVPSLGWNGTFKGQVVSEGVYVYYAEVEFIDGVIVSYSGDVTVIR